MKKIICYLFGHIARIYYYYDYLWLGDKEYFPSKVFGTGYKCKRCGKTLKQLNK